MANPRTLTTYIILDQSREEDRKKKESPGTADRALAPLTVNVNIPPPRAETIRQIDYDSGDDFM